MDEPRIYGISEELLIRVIQMLLRPSGETVEVINALNSLPVVRVEEEHHHQDIGFAPPEEE